MHHTKSASAVPLRRLFAAAPHRSLSHSHAPHLHRQRRVIDARCRPETSAGSVPTSADQTTVVAVAAAAAVAVVVRPGRVQAVNTLYLRAVSRGSRGFLRAGRPRRGGGRDAVQTPAQQRGGEGLVGGRSSCGERKSQACAKAKPAGLLNHSPDSAAEPSSPPPPQMG